MLFLFLSANCSKMWIDKVIWLPRFQWWKKWSFDKGIGLFQSVIFITLSVTKSWSLKISQQMLRRIDAEKAQIAQWLKTEQFTNYFGFEIWFYNNIQYLGNPGIFINEDFIWHISFNDLSTGLWCMYVNLKSRSKTCELFLIRQSCEVFDLRFAFKSQNLLRDFKNQVEILSCSKANLQ